MFVVQEAVAKNTAATEDLNGKRAISFLIIFANAAAGGLYPLYRFVTAWAESGDIDFNFITSSIKSGAEKCFGPEVVASLLASCACLSEAKKRADEAEAEVGSVRATAEEMRQHELVSTIEGQYNDAVEAKDQIDEARALYQDIKSGVTDVRSAGGDLCAEARKARTCDEGQRVEEQEDTKSHVGVNQGFASTVGSLVYGMPLASGQSAAVQLLSISRRARAETSSNVVFRQSHEMTEQSVSAASVPLFDNARINLKPRRVDMNIRPESQAGDGRHSPAETDRRNGRNETGASK